jgi:murein tripeptide amidase MpaA
MHLRYLLLLITIVFANASKKRYDDNILVSVTPSQEEHFEFLSKLEELNEIDIWNEISRNRSVHVMFNQIKSSWLIPRFQSLNMKPIVMHNDVQKLFDEEERTLKAQARSGTPRGIQDTFYTYDQLATWLREMVVAYPSLATLMSIGKTYENRDIWLIKLTANSGAPKKTAFLDFGIHAREWISPATGAYIINELLTKYATGGDAKTILDSWELHIVPVLNPDGYAYSHSRERMWRKNRKPVSGTCFGVDLNRNFGYQFNTGGSSASACADTFHGGSAMSENEAKALQSYMTGKQWTTYLTFHSYGQWWFTNWGYTTADPPNFAILKQKAAIGANAIRAVNGRTYTIGSSAQLLYIASGGSEDWTRGTLGILFSYCIELPPTGGTGFIAPTSEIKKTGGETYTGVVAYLNSF